MKHKDNNELDQELADVFSFQSMRSEEILKRSEHDSSKLDELLAQSSLFLAQRGVPVDDGYTEKAEESCEKDALVIPTWSQIVAESRATNGTDHSLDELFSEEELACQNAALRELNESYRAVHRLDKVDMAVCVLAGVVSAAVDMLLVGVPQRSPEGLKARPLGDYIRDHFEKSFPPEEMEKLAKLPEAKVPYDAPYNTNFTAVEVEGLWPTMHRLYSLGHDPLLGLTVGVHDILTGKMTTIDKMGRIAVQEIERYAGREESTVFASLCKQVLHFRTDVNTAMGLPAPLMGLFNLLQFGNIGEEDLTIAEIVQGMYYEGYDFIHFCAQSIPVMLTEVIVRLCYFAKRLNEGNSTSDSIPFSTNHEKHPKLGTMLFLSHSIATAINAGRVYFTKNPMEINYPQWITFAVYSFKQAKWALLSKPQKQHEHVMAAIGSDIDEIVDGINTEFEELSEEYRIVYL